MRKLNDTDYLQLVIDVGNCFVADNAYKINDDVREATLRVAKYFISFDKRDKGLALVGQNGVGKSLLFKIMGEIAPFFGKGFVKVKANMMGLDINKYKGRDALFIDDLGQDNEVKTWGNTIDMVYSVIDYRAQLWETGLYSKLFITTNLSTWGYDAISERYDKRIFDRLKAMCEMVPFGGNKTTSYRTTTTPIYPQKDLIEDIIAEFIRAKMGLDYSKDIHPITKKRLEQLLGVLRKKYSGMLSLFKREEYIPYFSARGRFDVLLSNFRDLVYSSIPARIQYEAKYLEIFDLVNGVEWLFPEDFKFKPELLGSGGRLKKSFEDRAKFKTQINKEERNKNTQSISELIKTD